MPAFIVKYPQITVELVGQDGNAFNIMGIVCKALRQNKIAEKEVKQFQEECHVR